MTERLRSAYSDTAMIPGLCLVLTLVLALGVLWVPLPFGSVTPLGKLGVELLSCTALALAALAVRRGQDFRPVALPAAAVAGVGLLAVVFSFAWPRGMVVALSPQHARLYEQAADLVQPGRAVEMVPLSVSPELSRSAALMWLAVAAALAAAVVAGHRRSHRRVLGVALLAVAAFEVVFGLRAWFAKSPLIWGVEVSESAARLRGTFVNPDHLAYELEIALSVVFAWAWWGARRARRENFLERRLLWAAPPVLIWLTLFVALAFTGSRAGLVAATLAVMAQGLLVALAQRRWRLAPLGVVVGLLGVVVVGAVGFREGLGRLLGTSVYHLTWDVRRQVYGASLELWRRFPVFGSGLGTFREAFPMVQPGDVDGTWGHAHNGYLELLATTGLLGVVLLGAGLVAVGVRLCRVLLRGRRSEDRAAAVAALGALVSLGLHEVVDFGLAMPAIAFTLAVVVGAAVGGRVDPPPTRR